MNVPLLLAGLVLLVAALAARYSAKHGKKRHYDTAHDITIVRRVRRRRNELVQELRDRRESKWRDDQSGTP